MSDTTTELPPRLQEIVEDFQEAEGQEKLEMLLEYSEQLSPLPEHLHNKRNEMDQVHECMTPVFVYAEKDGAGLHYFFDIPPESPTVRGYAALLAEGVDGASIEDVLRIPDDFFFQMGLQKVISGQRLNGISAMLAHMKRLAIRAS